MQTKKIQVSSVPDSCGLKSHLVSIVKDPTTAMVTIVAVKELGSHVAYIGYPSPSTLQDGLQGSRIEMDCRKIQTPGAITIHGYRLEPEAAKQLFPDIENWRLW